jgi:hypothetical protein
MHLCMSLTFPCGIPEEGSSSPFDDAVCFARDDFNLDDAICFLLLIAAVLTGPFDFSICKFSTPQVATKRVYEKTLVCVGRRSPFLSPSSSSTTAQVASGSNIFARLRRLSLFELPDRWRTSFCIRSQPFFERSAEVPSSHHGMGCKSQTHLPLVMFPNIVDRPACWLSIGVT